MDIFDLVKEFGPVISDYSRSDAIADGGLVEVDETVRHAARLPLPVVLTRAVHEGCVVWTDDDNDRLDAAEDEAHRLLCVLGMANKAIRQARDTDRVTFGMFRTPRDPDTTSPWVRIEAVLSADDLGQPCITLQMPGED